MEVTGASGSIASMAEHTNSRDDDERRIKTFTRRTLAGALVATAGFSGLAAAATHHTSAATHTDDSGSSTDTFSESSESDSSALAPSTSEPQQSFAPPVAQSGGS